MPGFIQELAPLAKDPDKNVRLQLALTLGLVNSPPADRALEPILKEADPVFLETLLAGFAGPRDGIPGGAHRLAGLGQSQNPGGKSCSPRRAGLLWRQRQPLGVQRFLHLVGEQPEGPRLATNRPARRPQLDARQSRQEGRRRQGPQTGSRRASSRCRPCPKPSKSCGTRQITKLAAAAEAMAKQLNWPGKDGKPLPVLAPLSPQHQTLYDLGRKEYLGLCAACHHPSGFGDAGKGPALLDSEWLDSDERVVRLVLYGLRGPISIRGEPFNPDSAMEMPGTYKVLDDQKIAAILTFVRREWRDGGTPMEPATVARIRAATKSRTDQWLEKELLNIK